MTSLAATLNKGVDILGIRSLKFGLFSDFYLVKTVHFISGFHLYVEIYVRILVLPGSNFNFFRKPMSQQRGRGRRYLLMAVQATVVHWPAQEGEGE